MCMQFNKHCILCVQYCVLNVEIIELDRCISSQKQKHTNSNIVQLSLKLAKLINLMLLDGSNQVRYVRSNVHRKSPVCTYCQI